MNTSASGLNANSVPHRLVHETCNRDALATIKRLNFVRKEPSSDPYTGPWSEPHPQSKPSNTQSSAYELASNEKWSPANEWLPPIGMIRRLSVIYKGPPLKKKGVDGAVGANMGGM